MLGIGLLPLLTYIHVFVVSVCSFHWRIFCTYGEVTIVVRCSKIKSDALTLF